MKYVLSIVPSPARIVYGSQMNTVLITGCSSGYGLATARYFLDRDWTVIATMRTPRESVLPASPRLRVLPLDVTDPESIRRAVEAAAPIDVLVSNAGVGLISAFESTSMDMVRDIFETNTFGTMALVHAVLPQFRERKSGVVVNVSSTVTMRPLLLLSIYTASKAAINAFTESLALELEPFNIRVRLVLPGRSSETRFGENARPRMANSTSEPYAPMLQGLFAKMGEPGAFTRPQDVAEAVWRAATDPLSPMRIPAGADAVALASSPN
jgi:NAD(P)-dependent dehydrogenase (short-subunit alcohol dehydrogenase family)